MKVTASTLKQQPSLEVLKKAFDVAGGPAQQQNPQQPELGSKLDRTTLDGNWEGEKDGVTVLVQFQWLSEHQQVRWEVKQAGSSTAAQMTVVIEPDGSRAQLVFRKGLDFEATQGRLTLNEGGSLRLEILPNPNVKDPGYPAVKDLILKRLPDTAPDLKTGTNAKPAGGEPESPTADQIVDAIKTGLPVLGPLQGILKTNGTGIPVSVNLTASRIRIGLENPKRDITLDIGGNSWSLQEETGGSTRELPAAEYSLGVAGSNLSYEDLSMRYLFWPKRELRSDVRIKLQECFVVDLFNPDRLGEYSVVRLSVRKESGAIMRMQGYDWDGKRIKSSIVKTRDSRTRPCTISRCFVGSMSHQP